MYEWWCYEWMVGLGRGLGSIYCRGRRRGMDEWPRGGERVEWMRSMRSMMHDMIMGEWESWMS